MSFKLWVIHFIGSRVETSVFQAWVIQLVKPHLGRAPLERQLFQFVLHLVNAEQLGQGGEDQESLVRDAHALLRLQRTEV